MLALGLKHTVCWHVCDFWKVCLSLCVPNEKTAAITSRKESAMLGWKYITRSSSEL